MGYGGTAQKQRRYGQRTRTRLEFYMGWWKQDEQGHSFADAKSGVEMAWGDPPADVMSNALDEIVKCFTDPDSGLGRQPTRAEIRAGLEFDLAVRDLPESVPADG